MTNKIVWVKFYDNNYYKILLKLNSIDVNIYNNIQKDNSVLVQINYEDYKKIKKYLISYKTEIVEVSGILKIKQMLKKYFVFLVTIIISIMLLLIVNKMVFKIDIKSNNHSIQTLLKKELEKNGLTIFKLKKSHSKIEKIVDKILEDNKDVLEWLEIKYDGLIMVVNVTEKTIIKEEEKHDYCHIVANRDAKILSLNIYRGVALKEVNDYVLKGDTILSGDITFNEEVKNQVCASGEVYGEVWYKVKVTVPFLETSIKYTGKNRYNINIKYNDHTYPILKSRIDKRKEEEINIYKLNDFEINIVKEKEYEEINKTLSEKEAYDKALDLVTNKINLKLNKDESILLKKVLKKEVNNSKIYLEVFVITKENIGMVKVIEKEL